MNGAPQLRFSATAARTDLVSSRTSPHARANEGCRLTPQGGGPSFVRSAEIESLAAPEHGFGRFGVAAVLLMQDEAGQESEPGSASFLGLDDDARRGLAPLGEKRKDGDVAEPPVQELQQLAETVRPMDQREQRVRRGHGGKEAHPRGETFRRP